MTFMLIRNAKGALYLIERLEAEVPYVWDEVWDHGGSVQIVGGCRARALVAGGIEHDTSLRVWSDGKAHRRPPPAIAS